MMLEDQYTSGKYLEKWPTWHTEISPWKARQILRMLKRHQLAPKTICEVGCGAGEILKQLQAQLPEDCTFWGYEISPQAVELCQSRANDRLHFKLADLTQEEHVCFDLLLIIDVIEHLEDYFQFLRVLKAKAALKLLHIPLDLAAKTILQGRLIQVLEDRGHIHYFTKETALQILQDVGYEVLDHFYTPLSIEFPTTGRPEEVRRQLMRLPRQVLFTLNADVAVRSLGGWSLLVLAR